ncbi:MAG: GNAT family N-acetyltransferase [Actinomycetia bacterium]|nr:GNAT family N-acetyltransferase [Actinomycetes bacterium]
MTYELVAADTLNAEQVHDLRAIYEGGYTVADRAPWRRVYANRLSTDHALALVRGDTAAGFALLRAPSDAGYALLRYFVIDPSQRGHGVGARFWHLVTAYASKHGHRRLIWDVAAPDDPAAETDERASQRGRIGIHERAGGSLVPIGEYDDGDTADSPPQAVAMRLVATSLGEGMDTIDARGLRRIAMDVCAHRYEFAIEATRGAVAPIDSGHEP